MITTSLVSEPVKTTLLDVAPMYSLYWTSVNASSFNTATWRTPESVIGITASASPSLGVYNGLLYSMSFSINSVAMFLNQYNSNNTWLSWRITGPFTNWRPGIVDYQGGLYCFFKGPYNVSNVGYISSNDPAGGWWGPTFINEVLTSAGPALAVLPSGWLCCIYANQNDNGELYSVGSISPGSWDGWGASVPLGGSTSTSPGVAFFNNLLWCVYRSEDSDHKLYVTTTPDGSAWTAPVPIPDQTTDSDVALCVLPGQDKLLCVYGDGNGGKELYYTYTTSNNPSYWSPARAINGVSRAPGQGVGLAVMNGILYCYYLAN